MLHTLQWMLVENFKYKKLYQICVGKTIAKEMKFLAEFVKFLFTKNPDDNVCKDYKQCIEVFICVPTMLENRYKQIFAAGN